MNCWFFWIVTLGNNIATTNAIFIGSWKIMYLWDSCECSEIQVCELYLCEKVWFPHWLLIVYLESCFLAFTPYHICNCHKKYIRLLLFNTCGDTGPLTSLAYLIEWEDKLWIGLNVILALAGDGKVGLRAVFLHTIVNGMPNTISQTSLHWELHVASSCIGNLSFGMQIVLTPDTSYVRSNKLQPECDRSVPELTKNFTPIP